MFQKWTFTEKQALLAHAAALNVECTLPAVFVLSELYWAEEKHCTSTLMALMLCSF